MPAEVKGIANMPAPIVVPATISVLPSVLFFIQSPVNKNERFDCSEK